MSEGNSPPARCPRRHPCLDKVGKKVLDPGLSSYGQQPPKLCSGRWTEGASRGGGLKGARLYPNIFIMIPERAGSFIKVPSVVTGRRLNHLSAP